MCDFSLHAVRSRPAKVGDKLITRMFNSGTSGFCAPEDHGMAVCLLPGTEVSFTNEVRRATIWPLKGLISHKTAIFRQVNKNNPFRHHDALEFPDGRVVLLTLLQEGQQASVLQLPAEPQNTRSQPAVTPREVVEFEDLVDQQKEPTQRGLRGLLEK